jgi:hypothetical protein
VYGAGQAASSMPAVDARRRNSPDRQNQPGPLSRRGQVDRQMPGSLSSKWVISLNRKLLNTQLKIILVSMWYLKIENLQIIAATISILVR